MKQRKPNIFSGGMDADSSPWLIGENDFVKALNIRNGVNSAQTYTEVENLKGTELVSFTQPSGDNTVIGSYRNNADNSVLYAVWNSNGNHQWRRYKDGVIERLAEFDWGWESDKKITAIDLVDNKLLYWTDSKPRKINIEKSTANKKRKANLYVISDYPFIQPFFLTVNGQQAFTAPINDIDDLLAFLNDNAVNPNGTVFTAVKCKDYIEIEFADTAENEISVTTNPNNGAIVIPQNYYSQINEEVTDAGKFPLNCPPEITLRQNNAVNYNYLDRKVFQFRTRVKFDDFEESVLSPISDITVEGCNNSGNFVRVDFTDTRLSDIDTLCIITGIEVLVREGNDGTWKIAKRFEQEDIWSESKSFTTQYHDFYNDSVQSAISDAIALKQYDVLPIEPTDNKYSISQEFANDRLFYGNFVENYEQPCVDASIDLSFTEEQRKRRFNIQGIARIVNPEGDISSNGTPKYSRIGMIINLGEEDGEPTVDVYGGTNRDYVAEKLQGRYRQILPEGGFPFYLRGTPYLGISKQKSISDLAQNQSGAVVANSSGAINSIKDYYGILNTNTSYDDVFSTFEIKSVPAGEYVLAVASHECNFGDRFQRGSVYDLNNGLAWQKTSANVLGYNSGNGNYVDTIQSTNLFNGSFWEPFGEIRLESLIMRDTVGIWNSLGDLLNVKEVTVKIEENGDFEVTCFLGTLLTGTADSNGDLFVGEFLIEDLIDTYTFANKTISKEENGRGTIQGYLIDAEGSVVESEIVQGATMELQRVTMFNQAFLGVQGKCMTDANGYFYLRDANFAGLQGQGLQDAKPTLLAQSINNLTIRGENDGYRIGSIGDLLNENTQAGSNSGEMQGSQSFLYEVIIYSSNQQVSEQCRTLVRGRVVDSNGNGISGIPVAYERNGRFEQTDAGGNFSIIAYGDYSGYVTGDFSSGTQGSTNRTYRRYENGIVIQTINQSGFPEIDINNPKRILDDLLLVSDLSCEYNFSNNLPYIKFNLDIDPISNVGFNNSNPYAPAFLNNVIATLSPTNFGRFLKGAGGYRFALMYVDKLNRRHQIFNNDDLDIYVPFITEDVSQYLPLPSQQANGVFSPTLTINSDPPEWADKLYLLRTKDENHNFYLQFPVDEVVYAQRFDSDGDVIVPTTYSTFTANEIYLSLERALQNYKDLNADSKKSYSFTEGDRIRFISNQDGNLFGEYIDLPIKGVQSVTTDDITRDYIIVENNDDLGEILSGTLVEVYSPKLQADEELFYEIPYCIDIVNGLHVHPDGSNVLSNGQFTFTLPLITGDAYRRTRTVPIDNVGNLVYFVEDDSLSDFWVSRVQDIGRLNFIDDTFGRLLRKNAVRFTDKYISGTKINNLNRLFAADVKEIPRDYGAIRHLATTDDDQYRQVLMGICENNTGVFYLGEEEISSVSGTPTLIKSSSVLGTFRLLKGSYGTINPESVSRLDGRVYWWDENRNRVIRYSLNGMTPISDNKMKSYFDSVDAEFAIGAYHDFYEEYILSFKTKVATVTQYNNIQLGDQNIVVFSSDTDLGIEQNDSVFISQGSLTLQGKAILVSETSLGEGQITYNYRIEFFSSSFVNGDSFDVLRGETLAFSEIDKRWKSFYSFAPEYFGTYDDQLVGFVNGNLWQHDSDNVERNNFYGEQYKSNLRFISKSLTNNIFWGLREVANSVWYCEQIKTVPNSSYPNGMLSRIKKGNFSRKEGDWWANFLRDINDPNPAFSSDLERLLKGRHLRGEWIEINLENEGTEKSTIRSVEVFETLSQRT